MEITAERYTKSGVTTSLRFGYGRGAYFVVADDVVIAQTIVQSAAYGALATARTALTETGWTKSTTPAFIGR